MNFQEAGNTARHLSLAAALSAATALMPLAVHALTMVEGGFQHTTLSMDFSKQVELGVGPDTCLYYGTFDGLTRRCAPSDPGTVCDENLTFPVGIAFSTGGSFGNYMYVADYGINDIHRSEGCATATPFAEIAGPGSIAFPPAGSAYGDFLYACTVYDGPIHRVSSTGTVTDWLALAAAYLRFGPGGAWGTELYATEFVAPTAPVATEGPGNARIVRVSSAAVVTPVVEGLVNAEGFDWGFDGDMFATDVSAGQILRVKPNGTKTLFANLAGAADVAFRPGEQALYVVSNMGGFYRIVRSTSTDVSASPVGRLSFAVSPNPSRGSCVFRLGLAAAGVARVRVVDASGRLVRRLPTAWRPAGQYALAWDGRDESGTQARPGAYFAQVQLAGASLSARVTIVE